MQLRKHRNLPLDLVEERLRPRRKPSEHPSRRRRGLIALWAILVSFPAWAEDPAQCRRYASAQTESIIQTINLRAQDAVVFIWNRLYSRCVLCETGVPEI